MPNRARFVNAGSAALGDQVCAAEQDPGVHRDRDDAAVQGASPSLARTYRFRGKMEANKMRTVRASVGGQAPVAVLAHHRGLARLPDHLRLVPSSPQYAAHRTSIQIQEHEASAAVSEPRLLTSRTLQINSDHTKITLETTNVFIDVTATDLTKLEIVVDMIVTMFAEYCAEPFM